MSTSQAQILEYCLKNVVFDGWTTELLEKACENAQLDKNYWKLPFPAGVVDVVDYFVAENDKKALEATKLEGLLTTAKVRELIKTRLELSEEYKEQIKSCLGVYALHPVRGTQATYRTVDSIWRAAGDTATDWNYYSKRALLAGVYGSTLLYWLNDKSEDHTETWKFLDKRLEDVAKFGKTIGSLKTKMGSFSL